MGGVWRLLAATTTTAGPDGIPDRVLAWEAGRLDGDPRRLVFSFTGADPAADPVDPCWEGYAPEVSAEPDRVVVRVRAYRSRTPLGPPAVLHRGGVRPHPGRAPAQPAGRPGGAGRPGPAAPPGPGPAGAALAARRLAAGPGVGQAGAGGRDTWERSYDAGGTAGGVGVSQVTVSDGATAGGRAGPQLPGARVVGRPAVRGHPAVIERSDAALAMVVRWGEGWRRLAVSTSFPTRPSAREVAALQRLLVRVARGLR